MEAETGDHATRHSLRHAGPLTRLPGAALPARITARPGASSSVFRSARIAWWSLTRASEYCSWAYPNSVEPPSAPEPTTSRKCRSRRKHVSDASTMWAGPLIVTW